MTWPGLGNVLPWLTTLVTVIAAVVTWVQISERTVSQAVEKVARHSEQAAREGAAGVSAEVEALAEKLANNDFTYMEDCVNRGLRDMGERIERVATRIGERLDRADQKRADMEARLRDDTATMVTRLREDTAAMEARILAAMQRHPDAGYSQAES